MGFEKIGGEVLEISIQVETQWANPNSFLSFKLSLSEEPVWLKWPCFSVTVTVNLWLRIPRLYLLSENNACVRLTPSTFGEVFWSLSLLVFHQNPHRDQHSQAITIFLHFKAHCKSWWQGCMTNQDVLFSFSSRWGGAGSGGSMNVYIDLHQAC